MKGNFHFLCALAVLAPAATQAATPGLDFSHDVSPGETVAALAVADFDGDGDRDFIVASAATSTVFVYSGNGSGGVDDGRMTLAPPAGTAFLDIAVGDFNNDSWPDIAGLMSNGNAVTWLNVAGIDGREFSEGATFPANGAFAIAAGDIGGDAADDVLVARTADDIFTVFISNDGAVDGGTDVDTGNFPVALQVVDVDGDADNDVLVLNAVDGTLQVFTNTGGVLASGTPLQTGSVSGAGEAFPADFVVADVNDDGRSDVVVANLRSNELHALYGDDLGGFLGGETLLSDWHGAVFTLSAGDPGISDPDANVSFTFNGVQRVPRLLARGDVTGDTIDDVIVNAAGRAALLVFPGNGSGDMQVFATPADLVNIYAGALNADARDDVAAISNDALQLFLNQETGNRAPVPLDRTVVIEECTRAPFDHFYDVDDDELALDAITVNADAPLVLHAVLPSLDVEAFDTGSALSVPLMSLDYTVNDGTAVSRMGSMQVVARGDGVAGCDSDNRFLLGTLSASTSIDIDSAVVLATLPDAVLTAPVININSVMEPGDAECATGTSSGTISIGGGSVSFEHGVCDDISVNGGILIFNPGGLVVTDLDGISVPETNSNGETEDDDAADGEELASDGSVIDKSPDGQAGGGAWFWLSLPLMLAARRRRS